MVSLKKNARSGAPATKSPSGAKKPKVTPPASAKPAGKRPFDPAAVIHARHGSHSSESKRSKAAAAQISEPVPQTTAAENAGMDVDQEEIPNIAPPKLRKAAPKKKAVAAAAAAAEEQQESPPVVAAEVTPRKKKARHMYGVSATLRNAGRRVQSECQSAVLRHGNDPIDRAIRYYQVMVHRNAGAQIPELQTVNISLAAKRRLHTGAEADTMRVLKEANQVMFNARREQVSMNDIQTVIAQMASRGHPYVSDILPFVMHLCQYKQTHNVSFKGSSIIQAYDQFKRYGLKGVDLDGLDGVVHKKPKNKKSKAKKATAVAQQE